MGKSVSKLLKFRQLQGLRPLTSTRGFVPGPHWSKAPSSLGSHVALTMNVVPHFSNRGCASATVPTTNLYSMYGYMTHGS
jgi:hypothetical protein